MVLSPLIGKIVPRIYNTISIDSSNITEVSLTSKLLKGLILVCPL